MINIKNLDKYFGTFHVLKNCNTSIDKGSVVVICGPSGSGKSTLIKCINGLEQFNSGKIIVDSMNVGELKSDIPKLRAKIGMVFQDYKLLDDRNLFENVALPLHVLGYSAREIPERVEETLELVGLEGKDHHLPNELSGGEQQRVAIARALVNSPSILFADEPTGNLDSKTGKEVLEIFKELNEKGQTIVVITHEHTIAKQSQRTITIKDGEIESDSMN